MPRISSVAVVVVMTSLMSVGLFGCGGSYKNIKASMFGRDSDNPSSLLDRRKPSQNPMSSPTSYSPVPSYGSAASPYSSVGGAAGGFDSFDNDFDPSFGGAQAPYASPYGAGGASPQFQPPVLPAPGTAYPGQDPWSSPPPAFPQPYQQQPSPYPPSAPSSGRPKAPYFPEIEERSALDDPFSDSTFPSDQARNPTSAAVPSYQESAYQSSSPLPLSSPSDEEVMNAMMRARGLEPISNQEVVAPPAPSVSSASHPLFARADIKRLADQREAESAFLRGFAPNPDVLPQSFDMAEFPQLSDVPPMPGALYDTSKSQQSAKELNDDLKRAEQRRAKRYPKNPPAPAGVTIDLPPKVRSSQGSE